MIYLQSTQTLPLAKIKNVPQRATVKFASGENKNVPQRATVKFDQMSDERGQNVRRSSKILCVHWLMCAKCGFIMGRSQGKVWLVAIDGVGKSDMSVTPEDSVESDYDKISINFESCNFHKLSNEWPVIISCEIIIILDMTTRSLVTLTFDWGTWLDGIDFARDSFGQSVVVPPEADSNVESLLWRFFFFLF